LREDNWCNGANAAPRGIDDGSLSRLVESPLELVLDSEAASEIEYSSLRSSAPLPSAGLDLSDWDLDAQRIDGTGRGCRWIEDSRGVTLSPEPTSEPESIS